MLFNTLGYAEFLAIVFGVAWLLVDRRNSLWLPWFALVGLSVHLSGQANAPSSITLGAVTAAAGLLTFALRQKAAKTSSGPAPGREAPVESVRRQARAPGRPANRPSIWRVTWSKRPPEAR